MSTASDRSPTDEIDGNALDWALRMADPDADWQAFTVWLEGDADRAARYDAALSALDQVTETVAEQVRLDRAVANDVGEPEIEPAPERSGRRFWLGGGVAAALAVALGLGSWYQRDETYMVATRPGEQRTVGLKDGSSIILAGDSKVKLDPAEPRSATVESGEMLFVVRHDEKAPFRVRAGELRLVDLGTVFSVRKVGPLTRVAVAEGAVEIGGKGVSLRLDPGQAAVFEGGAVRRELQDVAEIGGWRKGLLTFNDATIEEVAEELTRNLGLRITAAPAVKRRPFSGTLELTALRDDPTLLSSLLNVHVQRDGNVWTLEDRQ